MKRSLALLVVLFFTAAKTTHAAPIVHESFDYSPGLLTNQNGGSGWAGAWTNATSATNQIVSPGLRYDDGLYQLTTSSNAWQSQGLAARSVRYLPSTLGETGQVLYVSFLGRLNNLFGYAGVFLDENNTANFSIGQSVNSATWGCVRIGAFGLGSTNSVTNLTFVVVRLNYTNNNVIVRFYLNPPLDAEPPTHPTIPPLTTTAFKFNRVRLEAGNSLRTDLLDELRIGTTWDDVAPHTFAPHLLTVTNASVFEGNSGTTNLPFNVRLSRTNDLPVSVNYYTTNGSATAGSDYVATNGVVTFNPGETNKTVSVAVIGETTVEFDELFSVVLSNAVNGQIRSGQGMATGTILDDDYVPPPLIAYEPFAYTSGISINGLNGGTGWSNAWSGFGVTTISSPGLTYVAGSLSLAVSSNASRLSDPSFSFYIRGVQDLARIKSGSVYLSFLGEMGAGSPNISLYDGANQLMIIGKYASANNWTAAVFGAIPRVMESSVPVSTRSLLVLRFDYAGSNTTVRFYVNPPLNAEPTTPTGQTNVTGLRFDVIGLNSGGPSAAATFDEIRVASTWAAAVPQGPPPPPNITITDAAVYESNSGTNLVFNVALSSATITNVLVNFATSNGTALADSDYVATNGVLTFTPGETNKIIIVPVIGDAVAETNETFSVILSNTVNGIIQDGVGTGFILDEDTPPRLAIGPGRVFEGDSGVTQAVFRVRLSQLYSGTVSVDYSTTNGSATAGADYASAGGTVTFAPGEIRKNIAVQVFGDTTPELNETFAVRLNNPVNCTPVNTNGPGLIGDDDTPVPAVTNLTLLKNGDPVPGEPGRVFKQFIGAPVINAYNELAFVASTMLTNGTALETNLWLWTGPTNNLRKIAGTTMQPEGYPAGSTYSGNFAFPNLDDEGNLTFLAGVNATAPAQPTGSVSAASLDEDDIVLSCWVEGTTKIEMIARKNEPVPHRDEDEIDFGRVDRIGGDRDDACGMQKHFDGTSIIFHWTTTDDSREFRCGLFDADSNETEEIIGPGDHSPFDQQEIVQFAKCTSMDKEGNATFVLRFGQFQERTVIAIRKADGTWVKLTETGDLFSQTPPFLSFAGTDATPGVTDGGGDHLFLVGFNSFPPPISFLGATHKTTAERIRIYSPSTPFELVFHLYALGDNVGFIEASPTGTQAGLALYDPTINDWLKKVPVKTGDSVDLPGGGTATIANIISVDYFNDSLDPDPHPRYPTEANFHVILSNGSEAIIAFQTGRESAGWYERKFVSLLTPPLTKIERVTSFLAGAGAQRGYSRDYGAMILNAQVAGASLLNLWPRPPVASPVEPLTLAASGHNGLVTITVNVGTPGFYALECSSDLTTWRKDATFFGVGPFNFTTSTENDPVMFFRARATAAMSKENQLFLQGKLSAEFGANGFLDVDLNADGVTDTTVQADDGRFKLWVDTTSVPNNGQIGVRFRSANGTTVGPWAMPDVVKPPGPNTATEIPFVPIPYPNIGKCVSCPECEEGSSAAIFNSTATPVSDGVQLADGSLQAPLAGLTFGTIGGSAGFNLVHGTGYSYDGAYGKNMSLSGDLRIQRIGANNADLWSGNNQRIPLVASDGITFTLPNVSGATATYSAAEKEFTVTLVNGTKYCIAEGLLNQAGHLVSVEDADGNKTAFAYNACGNLVRQTADNGADIEYEYSDNPHLRAVTDHLGRKWEFVYDASNRLVEILSPATEFADIAAGDLVTDSTLTTVTQPRRTLLAYTNVSFPNYVTSITDERGAVARAWTYDAQGRVSTQTINGKTTQYIYGPTANPAPLTKLEPDNILTRVVDPEGNVVDTEMVGPGHPGQYGIRRRITWTESGKGNAPLRAGEPLYYEQRWLQDCDCLTPVVVTQPFSSQDTASLTFDANKIPQNWPRSVYTYNTHRQPLVELYTDGTESIRTEMTYQPNAYGVNNQFSKTLTRTEARAFDGNPIYSGLNFVHSYEYDTSGNMTKHTSPTVTRGVISPQTVVESWTFNSYGQVLTHTDPNANITVNTYHTGPSIGGSINSKGNFFGYLASTTRGATGSANPVANLTTAYFVNALGRVTRTIDPMGRTYDVEYNNLGEVVRELEPQVTLRNNQQVRYETRYVYDGAGNRIMTRRRNFDFDGSISANEFIDRSMSYDAGNNLLVERVEVDGNDANDHITRYAYDQSDQLVVIQQPEGNRVFRVYDERRMLFKQFSGVAPGASLTDGYPTDKRAVTLGGTAFVALTRTDYDTRGNPVISYDGRGNTIVRGFDFRNRQVFEADQNRNGWVRQYDDAGNVLTMESGPIPAGNGVLTSVLSRSYSRFDELGRQYQTVQDFNLLTSELTQVDPAGTDNSSFRSRFDAGSRTLASLDANANTTTYTYDAAGRRLTVTDALNNLVTYVYNANSSVTTISETEVAGPGATGAAEAHTTAFDYDQLNRRLATHVRGLNGNSIDHVTRTAYDSRGNVRLVEDAEGVVQISTYDDLSRLVRSQRYDRDPALSGAVELQRSEFAYDRDSRKILDRAYSQVGVAGSAQDTRYAYDAADRLIRTVYPDSDDPIAASGNGGDGIYDRIETAYDANSNPIAVTEQRGVVFNNVFDFGNRLTDQMITLPASVPGTDRQQFVYDALNRLNSARNNYSRVDRSYDALSRMTQETQSIRLDGSGFVNGWEQPVNVLCNFDKQSNRTGCSVTEGVNTDLTVGRTYDTLNRVETISAAYFNVANHLIADYNYFGPGRIQTKTLGNGAKQMNTFDVKRRLATLEWRDPANNILVGFEYSPTNGSGYDKVDNVLYERWLHDGGRYDHYRYNKRYELTGVEYRSTSATPPTAFGDTFNYDDNYNRTSASFGDPFNADPNTADSYTANAVNEYTQIVRDGTPRNPTHDRAGNTTTLPVRPVTANPNQPDVNAAARWDAFNLLFDIDTGVTPQQHYRYDPFRRRIVALESTSSLQGSRRFIYDGWDDVEERVFSAGATLGSAPSILERIYVQGHRIDEPLLAAIDRNGDHLLGAPNQKNVRSMAADQEYYCLENRLGSVEALLDSDNGGRVLEFCKSTVWGESTVLPILDANMDGFEDSPSDIADNLAAGTQRQSTEFGNTLVFSARRFDHRTGLNYYRNRFQEPREGRFLSKDPEGYEDALNPYQCALNSPAVFTDPLGQRVTCFGFSGSVVVIGGVGVSVLRCSDECGNWAWVVVPSMRAGVEVSFGVGASVSAGGIPEFLSGSWGFDINASIGPVSGGGDFSSSGPSGAHAGVGKWGLGASAGAGKLKVIASDTSKGYPCPCPEKQKSTSESHEDWSRRMNEKTAQIVMEDRRKKVEENNRKYREWKSRR